jgi:tRNA(Arg) A34 adenosine deaminase TadA
VLTDEDGMRLAIAEAREGLREFGGGEVGCAIVRDGRVLQLNNQYRTTGPDSTLCLLRHIRWGERRTWCCCAVPDPKG